MKKRGTCEYCGGPLQANHLWCPGDHHEWGSLSDMWRDFCAGDWYSFWTGGPVRNTIYERMKRILRWFDTLDF